MDKKQIWLIYREEDCKKNEWYINHYKELGEKYQFDISLVLTRELRLSIDETCQVDWVGHPEQKPDAAIIRTIDPKLSYHFELAGIRTFNPSEVSRVCNDKALTYEKISLLGIKSIPTLLCKRELFLNTMHTTAYPAVVKTVDGHGGKEVFLLQDKNNKELNTILESTHSDFVIQPLVGKKHQDLRVYVLGDEIIGCVLRTSKGDFKANYSLGGTVCSYQLTNSQCLELNKIISAFPFDLVGIDFIIGDDGSLIFNEIEDVVGARMLYECTQIDIVELYLKYIKETIENRIKKW